MFEKKPEKEELISLFLNGEEDHMGVVKEYVETNLGNVGNLATESRILSGKFDSFLDFCRVINKHSK